MTTEAGWTVTVSKAFGNRLFSLHSPSGQLSSHFLTDMVHILGDKSFLIRLSSTLQVRIWITWGIPWRLTATLTVHSKYHFYKMSGSNMHPTECQAKIPEKGGYTTFQAMLAQAL